MSRVCPKLPAEETMKRPPLGFEPSENRFRTGIPNGIRTRAAALKGRCPRPLDDGDLTAEPYRSHGGVPKQAAGRPALVRTASALGPKRAGPGGMRQAGR